MHKSLMSSFQGFIIMWLQNSRQGTGTLNWQFNIRGGCFHARPRQDSVRSVFLIQAKNVYSVFFFHITNGRVF
jgi:hypothetical protein